MMCAGKTVRSLENMCQVVPYLSASAVVIDYEEALYQVYAPLPVSNLHSSTETGQAAHLPDLLSR